MSREKTIAAIGVSDEEVAHLRLLMRKCAANLNHRWQWGDEKNADLLVVDPSSFSGQMARTRAVSSGTRCAVFSDVATPDAELVMSRPLLLANVIQVLNRAAAESPSALRMGAGGEGFYSRDAGEHSDDSVSFPDFEAPGRFGQPLEGLDDFLKHTPLELRDSSSSSSRDSLLSASPAIELGVAPGASGNKNVASARAGGVPQSHASRSPQLSDLAPHALREWLTQDLLKAPAQIVVMDLPPLVLDPKQQVAHSSVGLGELGPYCEARWRLCDWRPLTTAELSHLRATQPALAYWRLTWLDVLMHSNGQLRRHLDPAGTYRLTRWVEVDNGFARYFRIASSMMQQPARLHEIAAASGASMGDVFDFVNACDEIGAIEWHGRPRDPVARPSLLNKLRRPFG